MCCFSTWRDGNSQPLQRGAVKDGSYGSALSHFFSHTCFLSPGVSGAQWPEQSWQCWEQGHRACADAEERQAPGEERLLALLLRA